MRKTILLAGICAALSFGAFGAKHGDDSDCRHDRHYRGQYREDDRDNDRNEHRHGHGHEGLPPGLERQLIRNGHLPPGLEKKMHRVPDNVCRRLPPLPQGAVRGFYGGHVIVYNPHTTIILDVFGGISF